jgi:hypothetical protein
VTLLRRRRIRQRFAARLAARLDELVGASGARSAGGAAFGPPALVGRPLSTRPDEHPPSPVASIPIEPSDLVDRWHQRHRDWPGEAGREARG